MRAFLAVFAFGIAAACAPTETPAADPVTPPVVEPTAPVAGAPDGADQCGAKANASLVGKLLTDPTVPPASRLVRHIRPGDAVTEDYVVERLNLYATDAGVIERLTCG